MKRTELQSESSQNVTFLIPAYFFAESFRQILAVAL